MSGAPVYTFLIFCNLPRIMSCMTKYY